jgi:hypothetical protein
MVFKDAGNDPSLRMLRSSLGRQVTSPHETLPQWGFGTGDRNAASKVGDASASNADIDADEKENRNHLDRIDLLLYKTLRVQIERLTNALTILTSSRS